MKDSSTFFSNIEIIWIYSGTLQLQHQAIFKIFFISFVEKKSSGFKSSQDILLNVFFTCRCGRPEKAWEAREDIRQSERSIFRRFGRAWKINQSYQCGGVQFFSCFYTFHRNSAVEGLRNILSGFMTKCVLFLIIARCLVCFFIFNIEMNYGFQLLIKNDKKWPTSASDSLIGLFFHI